MYDVIVAAVLADGVGNGAGMERGKGRLGEKLDGPVAGVFVGKLFASDGDHGGAEIDKSEAPDEFGFLDEVAAGWRRGF